MKRTGPAATGTTNNSLFFKSKELFFGGRQLDTVQPPKFGRHRAARRDNVVLDAVGGRR
jgi:hypothetical protein